MYCYVLCVQIMNYKLVLAYRQCGGYYIVIIQNYISLQIDTFYIVYIHIIIHPFINKQLLLVLICFTLYKSW